MRCPQFNSIKYTNFTGHFSDYFGSLCLFADAKVKQIRKDLGQVFTLEELQQVRFLSLKVAVGR